MTQIVFRNLTSQSVVYTTLMRELTPYLGVLLLWEKKGVTAGSKLSRFKKPAFSKAVKCQKNLFSASTESCLAFICEFRQFITFAY